jgi:polyribonucleotide nucleotidyltransferase
VIGTGGKVIREITEKTGAKIDIEDDGTIKVAAVDAKADSAPSTGSRASWPSRKSA